MFELISLAGGALVRFLFQLIAQNQKNKQDQWNRMLTRNKREMDNMNVVRKDESRMSQNVRRLIALSTITMIFVAVVGGAILDVPVYMPEVIDDTWNFLFLSGGEKYTEWTELKGGIVYVPEVRMFAAAITGFYLTGAVFKD